MLLQWLLLLLLRWMLLSLLPTSKRRGCDCICSSYCRKELQRAAVAIRRLLLLPLRLLLLLVILLLMVKSLLLMASIANCVAFVD
jgi:hypothetical protein